MAIVDPIETEAMERGLPVEKVKLEHEKDIEHFDSEDKEIVDFNDIVDGGEVKVKRGDLFELDFHPDESGNNDWALFNEDEIRETDSDNVIIHDAVCA